ncbi:MAG: hypothetical protein WAQ98_30705 [Blastocatellia bacterium]
MAVIETLSRILEETGVEIIGFVTFMENFFENGILASDTPKGAVSMSFPTSTSEILFPTLFPVT